MSEDVVPLRAPSSVRRAVGALLSVGVIAVPAIAGSSAPSPAPTSGATCVSGQPADQRRGLWYAIGDRPTVEEVDAAPSRYGVVVLNPWETWALERLKRADPSVTVLVYKDLASTRSYHAGPMPPTGVSTEEARENPAWYAVDDAGERVEWDPHPGHWQMAVWDTGYQQRWVENVVEEVVAAGWDGVLADNDLWTLGWYDDAVLAGTSTPAESDLRLRAGLAVLVERAGRALQAHEKVLVPNVSDARLEPGRWTAHAAFGGAMEENFVHWGTDSTAGHLWDWGETGWETQTGQLAGPGLVLAVTRAAPRDTGTLLYAYASVLVRGGGKVAWSPSTTPVGDYTEPETLPQMSIPLGATTTQARRTASGVWVRTFRSGWAAVNPTQTTVTVTPPEKAVDEEGRRIRAVVLPPTSGAVYRLDGRGAC